VLSGAGSCCEGAAEEEEVESGDSAVGDKIDFETRARPITRRRLTRPAGVCGLGFADGEGEEEEEEYEEEEGKAAKTELSSEEAYLEWNVVSAATERGDIVVVSNRTMWGDFKGDIATASAEVDDDVTL